VLYYIYIYVLYNVGGSLISSEHQLYRVTPLKTPFGLLIPLSQSQSHVTTFTHIYFLRCYTCTQLTITYTFVTTITCSTLARLHSLRALYSNLYCTVVLLVYSVRLHWLTSQLSVTFTDYHTLSHLHTSRVCLLSRPHS
jgi:hypothetical protein